MGTTSEKLTYLNTTKGLIKDKLNLGGANITTEPFRQYSSKLMGIYKNFLAHGTDTLWNNWEKVNATNVETTSLSPTIKGKMKVDLKGNTQQNGEPTPDTPVDIQVVSGDNTIKVEGKNLFDINSCPILEYAFYDGNGNPVSWAGTCGIREYIKLNENSTYAIKYNGSNNFLICFYNENKTYLSQLIKASGGNFTMPSTAKYIRFGIATAIANVEWCQIEKGSSSSEYTPYVSQTYPISLGNIELCKIGTYQDSIVKDNGKWFLNKQIGKVVLDGSESWEKYGAYNNFYLFYVDNITDGYTTRYGTSLMYGIGFANHFIWLVSSTPENRPYVRFQSENGKRLYVAMPTDMTLEEFKTWLSTHNTIVYYVLKTPTYAEITDTTLLSQLNALENANSYNNTTNVSQVNDDMPFILDLTALKEMA